MKNEPRVLAAVGGPETPGSIARMLLPVHGWAMHTGRKRRGALDGS